MSDLEISERDDLEIRQFYGRASAPVVKGENKLGGRAAPFMKQTMIGKPPWGFREQIKPSAFNKTIKDGDQVLLDNHLVDRPLARASAGTLRAHAGRTGFDWEADATDTTYAQDVLKNVRAGNYGGCSFSFEVVSDSWDEDTEDGIPLRTLNEVNCREISICTFPAYTDTSVAARGVVDRAMEFRNKWYERELLDWRPEGFDEKRADGSKPYGDVEYADPKNGKYPINSKARAKAAWSYINQPDNAAKYPLNGVTLASVKAKIKAACKKFGVEISDESNAAPEPDESRVYETDDFKLITTGEWNDRQWQEFTEELKWIQKVSAEGQDGEPGTPTRLTKEETALLNSRAAELRREIFKSRKPTFVHK